MDVHNHGPNASSSSAADANTEPIAENDEHIAEGKEHIAEGDGHIAEDDKHIAEDDEHVAEDDEHIAEGDENIAKNDEHIAGDDELIAEDKEHIAEDNEHIVKNDEHIVEDDEHIAEDKENIAENGEHIAADGEHIAEVAENGEHIAADGEHIAEVAENGKHIAEDGKHIAEVAENGEDEEDEEDIEEEEDHIAAVRFMIEFHVICASFQDPSISKEELIAKLKYANDFYQYSPTTFLLHFGQYLNPHQLHFFKKLQLRDDKSNRELQERIEYLTRCYEDSSKNQHLVRRRNKALEKLENETDYFTEKQMMLRNPTLYEEFVGQYLSDDERRKRDSDKGSENQNDMMEKKNDQMSQQSQKEDSVNHENQVSTDGIDKVNEKQSGEFDIPDTEPSHIPRKQYKISPEQKSILREQFYQKMLISFIEGRDVGIDYDIIDNNEEYQDPRKKSQDIEDKSSGSKSNEAEKLEAGPSTSRGTLGMDRTPGPSDQLETPSPSVT